jgi:hypothetical protein
MIKILFGLFGFVKDFVAYRIERPNLSMTCFTAFCQIADVLSAPKMWISDLVEQSFGGQSQFLSLLFLGRKGDWE